MHYLVLGILLIISLILESTILNGVNIAGIKPDLVLILVIFATFVYGKKEGIKLGFIFGLVEDIFLCKYIGLNAVTRMLTAYLIGTTEDIIFKDYALIAALGLFIGTYLNNFLYILVSGLANIDANFSINIWSSTLEEAIYNAVLALFLYSKFYKEATKGILRINK